MSEYDAPKRSLPYPLKNALVSHRSTEEDDLHGPSSFVWPSDSDERVDVLMHMSLNEYVVLSSAIDVGSDVAYGEDGLRVWWLWTRTLQEGVNMACCEDIQAQLTALETMTLQAQIQQREVTAQALRDKLEQQYEDCSFDINCIQTDGPTENWNGVDGSHDDALCKAITAFVYLFAQAKVNDLRSAQVVAFSSALLLPLLIPGLNFFYLVGAGIAIGLGYALVGVTTETAIAALTDTSALNDVVCNILSNIKDQPLAGSAFGGSAGVYDFESGSHAAIVSDFMNGLMDDNELTVYKMIGDAQTAIYGDQTPVLECACESEDPHYLTIVNHTGNIYPNDIKFMGAFAGGGERWSIALGLLPNSYWYMSIQDVDGRAFSINNAYIIVGSIDAWSVVSKYEGTISSNDTNDITGRPIYQPDLYIFPGAQARVLLEIYPFFVWHVSSDNPINGTITAQTDTSFTVEAVLDGGVYRAYVGRGDSANFTIASITTDGTITNPGWYSDGFTLNSEAVEVGDSVFLIYYESADPFTLSITI